MKQYKIYILVWLLITISNLSAQTKIIDIWQGKVPGAITAANYNLIADSSGSWTYMRHITNPLLEMYTPSKEKSNGTAVIICPGGGYWGLAYKHEGSQIASWFNSLGITAFILKYRLPDDSIMKDKSIGPMQDGQEAIRIVRRNAKKWNINPNKIGIMGFSAGGHLASTLSTHFLEKVYETKDTTSARPDFSILIYPVISMDTSITHMGSRKYLLGKDPSVEQIKRFSNELQVDAETPPAFIVHSLDDETVPVQNSIRYALALKKYKIPCELHIYQSGGHGYGLGRTSNTESTWPKACKSWLKANGF
jgi:acetyl esterase/lipase